MATLNVLVTAASRRVALVRAFQDALRRLGLAGKVVACDVNPLSPAVHVADAAYEVPLSTAPGYVEAVLDLCGCEEIGLVVPTIDDELPVFGRAASRFTVRGIKLAVSAEYTTTICNDKYRTCRLLREQGVAAAETFLPGRLPAELRFPVFVKPRAGRGSVAAFEATDASQLDFFLGYVPDPVVQSYLAGPEFTIDLFCDFHGRPLSVVPRERVVVRAGVIDRGRTVRDAALERLALSCARVLEFAGAINIQCRVVDGIPTVFEINPRFSGGIPLTIAAGADFPRWLIEITLGRPVPPALGAFTDGLWMTSYETALFLESECPTILRAIPGKAIVSAGAP
jgi:carbamoyl-phosphate synthase large subunit